jgi:uncharacterized protein YjiS (DUF1127 family)
MLYSMIVKQSQLTSCQPPAVDRSAVADREGPPRRWYTYLGAWLENHAARRRLWRCALLDPRFPKDIGMTPADVVMESRGPFWVAVPRRKDVRPLGRAFSTER